MIGDARTGVNLPQAGKWFTVELGTIDRRMFEEKRENREQEIARQHILEALYIADRNPKYQHFQTLFPDEKLESGLKIKEYKEMAMKWGEEMADWVHEGLEEAQRLTNGEPWYHLCNIGDSSKWHRMIIWKNGFVRLTGGTLFMHNAPSFVLEDDYDDERRVGAAVPKVVRYMP